jgi:type VI secretion system secreted protein VgrG
VKAIGETVERLTNAHKQHDALATLADQHDGAGNNAHSETAKAIAAQVKDIRGEGDDLSALTAPHVVLSSAGGIAATAAKSMHISSGEQVALSAGENISATAKGGFFVSVYQGARLFIQKLGIKLIAVSGKVEMRAENDEIEILAHKVLRLISETDWIELRGRKGLRLHGAGSMLEIADKIQFFSKFPVQFHCNLETFGPRNSPQHAQQPKNSEEISTSTTNRHMKLGSILQPHAAIGEAYGNTPYILYKDGKEVETGVTDDAGHLEFDYELGSSGYKVRLANGDEFAFQMVDKIDGTTKESEQYASNQGFRALNNFTDGRFHDN